MTNDKRMARQLPLIRTRIEGEKGEIRSVKNLRSRMFLRSPFRHLLGCGSLVLEICCKYPGDVGRWFVHVHPSNEVEWVWKSEFWQNCLPVARDGSASVNNRAICVPLLVLFSDVFIAAGWAFFAVGMAGKS